MATVQHVSVSAMASGGYEIDFRVPPAGVFDPRRCTTDLDRKELRRQNPHAVGTTAGISVHRRVPGNDVVMVTG
nr:hypothetical protein GCM10017611_00080 [Rhodococcus wratislaviensis]